VSAKKKTQSKSGSRTGSRGSASKAASSRTGSQKTGRASKKAQRSPLIDERAASDIWGIVLVTLGTVLALSVILPVFGILTGVATGFIDMGLGLLIGLGRFVLPFVLIIMGLTFFIPALRFSEMRFAVGLSLFLLAVIGVVGLVAVSAAQATPFESATLQSHGGYLGNALAWAVHALAGTAISYVIFIALGLIGLIITGFSLSAVFEWLSDWRADRAEERAYAQAEKAALMPRTEKLAAQEPDDAPARTTGRRKSPGINTLDNAPTTLLDDDEDELERTQVLKGKKKKPAEEKATEVIEPAAAVTEVLAHNTTAPRALEGFVLPAMDLLKKGTADFDENSPEAEAQQQATADLLVDTLREFGVDSQVVDWIVGPTVTLYKVDIASGVKMNKVTALNDNLAYALAAPTIRILAPIPGESLVGVEVPNASRSSVTLGDVIKPTDSGDGPLTLYFGRDVTGASIARNLASMPHLLVAGATGSGKSVAVNSMIMTMIMRATPAEVNLILIDPKRVEFSMFNGLPHLKVPVVTSVKKAASALAWAVGEMERRLATLEKHRARNIGEYNQAVIDGKHGEDALELPYLVIVIDELANLMDKAAKEVESSIVQIAQLARAAGIHLIVATQRPDANVVTGQIKANITNRVAFRTATASNSRVILDVSGAEKLTGLGDMLFSIPSWPEPKRIQGCYVSEDEIEAAVGFLRDQAGDVTYDESIFDVAVSGADGSDGSDSAGEEDALLWDAAEMVVAAGFGSTSGIQRRFSVGYSRAGRIMDMLHSRGVVGPPDGSKPREVLIDSAGLARLRNPDDYDEDDFEDEAEADFDADFDQDYDDDFDPEERVD